MSNDISGITEDDIADYLINSPAFFERHAELLSSIQLTSPHGNRAVSLQERQMEMLRGKIKGLEQKIIEMIRHSQENEAIADKLHAWTRRVLLTASLTEVPGVLIDELKAQFFVPQAALRVWGTRGLDGHDFSRTVDPDITSFATSLSTPYCGMNAGFSAIEWLDDAATIQSAAMIPLRHSLNLPAFGLLVLGSPDPTRFAADMGTDFLMRIGELASASLSRLVPLQPVNGSH